MTILKLIEILRNARRVVRDGPDRLRHESRRGVASARIHSLEVRHVLFVCHGNICRSPFAEHFFNNLCGPTGLPRAGSAGFIGPDRPCPTHAVTAAGAYGIDLSQHRSRLLNDVILRSADLVVVMNGDQERRLVRDHHVPRRRILLLGDFDPRRIDRRAIPDPVEQGLDVFGTVYERISRCVKGLAAAISASNTCVEPADG